MISKRVIMWLEALIHSYQNFCSKPIKPWNHPHCHDHCQKFPFSLQHMVSSSPAVSAENKPYVDALQYSWISKMMKHTHANKLPQDNNIRNSTKPHFLHSYITSIIPAVFFLYLNSFCRFSFTFTFMLQCFFKTLVNNKLWCENVYVIITSKLT